MKIEMGESLIYSWLRHEKQCQLAQTNWKASPYWEVDSRNDLQALAEKFLRYYQDKYQFDILKGCSLEQFIKQAELMLSASRFPNPQRASSLLMSHITKPV